MLPPESRRRSMVMTAEMVREQQIKTKIKRDEIRAKIGEDHRLVLESLSFILQLTIDNVIEFILDSPDTFSVFDSFLAANGRRSLMFYYQTQNNNQEGDEPSPKTLFITDGTGCELSGILIYYIRGSNIKAVGPRTWADEVCVGTVDCSKGCSVLTAVSSILSKVYFPAVQAVEKWGDLDENPQGQHTRKEFIKSIGSFIHFLDATDLTLSDSIVLQKCDVIDHHQYTNAKEYESAANNPDLLPQLEDLVTIWNKQIAQVSS